jgi:hypothetical protein
MYYGVSVPSLAHYADARMLAELAHDAEEAGWDGFFIGDHVATPWTVKVIDPWIALTAIALNTSSMPLVQWSHHCLDGAPGKWLAKAFPWITSQEVD